MSARIRTESVPEGLPFAHDAVSLGRTKMWNLQCPLGAFDIAFEPAGGSYDYLARHAHLVNVRGVEIPVADLADVVASKRLANGLDEALPDGARFPMALEKFDVTEHNDTFVLVADDVVRFLDQHMDEVRTSDIITNVAPPFPRMFEPPAQGVVCGGPAASRLCCGLSRGSGKGKSDSLAGEGPGRR